MFNFPTKIKKYDPTADIAVGAVFAVLVVGTILTFQVRESVF